MSSDGSCPEIHQLDCNTDCSNSNNVMDTNNDSKSKSHVSALASPGSESTLVSPLQKFITKFRKSSGLSPISNRTRSKAILRGAKILQRKMCKSSQVSTDAGTPLMSVNTCINEPTPLISDSAIIQVMVNELIDLVERDSVSPNSALLSGTQDSPKVRQPVNGQDRQNVPLVSTKSAHYCVLDDQLPHEEMFINQETPRSDGGSKFDCVSALQDDAFELTQSITVLRFLPIPTCLSCNQIFSEMPELIKHCVRNHASIKNEFSCATCDSTFTSIQMVGFHVCDWSQSTPLSQDNASQKSLPNFDLQLEFPIATKGSRDSLRSKNELAFDDPSDAIFVPFQSQPRKCTPDFQSYFCSLCDISFMLEESLLRHMKRAHFASESQQPLCKNVPRESRSGEGSGSQDVSSLPPQSLPSAATAPEIVEISKVYTISGNGGLPSAFPNGTNQVKREVKLIPQTYCHQCEINFLEENTLNRHLNRVHGYNLDTTPFRFQYVCQDCNYSWPSLQFKNEHNCTGRKKSKFVCNMCSIDCSSSVGLKDHKESVHMIFPKYKKKLQPTNATTPTNLLKSGTGSVQHMNKVVDKLNAAEQSDGSSARLHNSVEVSCKNDKHTDGTTNCTDPVSRTMKVTDEKINDVNVKKNKSQAPKEKLVKKSENASTERPASYAAVASQPDTQNSSTDGASKMYQKIFRCYFRGCNHTRKTQKGLSLHLLYSHRVPIKKKDCSKSQELTSVKRTTLEKECPVSQVSCSGKGVTLTQLAQAIVDVQTISLPVVDSCEGTDIVASSNSGKVISQKLNVIKKATKIGEDLDDFTVDLCNNHTKINDQDMAMNVHTKKDERVNRNEKLKSDKSVNSDKKDINVNKKVKSDKSVNSDKKDVYVNKLVDKSNPVNKQITTDVVNTSKLIVPTNSANSSQVLLQQELCICPSFNTRVENRLHLVFPLLDPVKCTEDNCSRLFSNQTWTASKGSLRRHLRQNHGITITASTFWCSFCQNQIYQPSAHDCLKGHLLLGSREGLAFCCPSCSFSCPTELGLRNHEQSHKRNEAIKNIQPLVIPKIVPTRKKKKKNNPLPPLPEGEENVHIQNVERDRAIQENQNQSQNQDQNSEEQSVAQRYLHHFRSLDQLETNENSFKDFCDLLQQFCVEVKESVSAPSPINKTTFPVGNDEETRPSTADDAQSIQKLYRRNKKRAIREITRQNGDRCKIAVEELNAHFSNLWAEKTCDHSYFDDMDAEDGRVEVFDRPFSVREVQRKLKSADNTAPGPDRITYHHWRQVDPSAKTICAIFNHCLSFKKIPPSWKESTTILIPKDGDPADIKNWRPIALSNTLYKLFAKCVTARLSDWCSRFDALSHCQKGFLPYDGVLEHNFALKNIMLQARERKKDVCVAWLDVSNAFGSIPHSAILMALKKAKVGDSLVDLVNDMYSECTTQIMAEGGKTESIPIGCGVKQGCPLSGLLFNIAIDPTLRRLQGASSRHHVLAFADDLALIADCPEDLQSQLDLLAADFARIQLELNPRKSVSLHLSGATPVGSRDTTFYIQNERLRVIQEFESHLFLGKPVGYNAVPDFSNINEIGKLGEAILSSLLAPWQRLEALKCFFYPSMQFAMRMSQYKKTDWELLDQAVRKGIKSTLYLPENASNLYLYGHRKLGCIGMPICAEESDLNAIDSAFKLLTSNDEIVAKLALEELCKTSRFRFRRPPSDADLGKFMSGEPSEGNVPNANQFQNTWTVARAASRRLGVTWEFDQQHPTLIFQDLHLQSSSRRKIMASIRDRFRADRTQQLTTDLKHQGKVLDCVSLAQASSHFISEGSFTRFADWRFIHRARLGLLPLNAYQKWKAAHEKRCRRCSSGDPETLPHVLQHCKYHTAAWTYRHNVIIERTKKAISQKCTILYENQKIPDTNHRPDLVIKAGNKIYVIDATVPFENTREALEAARVRKLDKYESLVEEFSTPGVTAEIVPLIVGALGSWDPKNDSFLLKFVTKSYLNLFRKLCVSDIIRWSRDIYVEHLSAIRQFDVAQLTNDNFRPEDPLPEDPVVFDHPTRDQPSTSFSANGQMASTASTSNPRKIQPIRLPGFLPLPHRQTKASGANANHQLASTSGELVKNTMPASGANAKLQIASTSGELVRNTMPASGANVIHQLPSTSGELCQNTMPVVAPVGNQEVAGTVPEL